MAQAVTTLSRRSLFAAAAIVPAVVLPAVAFGSPDVALLAFEPRLKMAWAEQGLVSDRLLKAGRAFADWGRRNPRPKMREPKVGTEAEYNVWFAADAKADDKSSVAHLNPNADLKAAIGEHQVAVAQWKRRERIARQQSGLLELQAAEAEIGKRISALGDEVRAIPATTLEGLKTKARMNAYVTDLAEAIVDDLRAMA